MPEKGISDARRVAVVANDALGNYVVSTPLLHGLKYQLHPNQLDYFSGPRVQEFWERDVRISQGYSIWGRTLAEVIADLPREPYDLVVNLEWSSWAKTITGLLSGPDTVVVGPSLAPDGRRDIPFEDNIRGRLWQDHRWLRETLIDDYDFLSSGFIGEIFYRLAYLDGAVPNYQVPTVDCEVDVPDVLIAMSASLPEKLWPTEKWLSAVRELQLQGLRVGLLGAKPSDGKQHWLGGESEDQVASMCTDLRGTLTLAQVADALSQARLVLTLDNGILHIAAAGGAKVVGLFRYGIHRLWAPPVRNMNVLTAGEHSTVADIQVGRVLETCQRALSSD